MAVVEFARNVLGLKDANSAEFDEKTTNPVIHIMDDQIGIDKKGGTMRLGAYPCILKRRNISKRIIWKKSKFQKDTDIDMNIIMNIKKD